MSKGTTARAVRVDDDLWDAAKVVAKINGDHLSEVIREALRAYIKENEDK